MKIDLGKILSKHKIVAALCDEKDLEDLCLSNVRVAFVLCGDFQTLPDIVSRIKKANIIPLVHIDFIDGLSAKEAAVDFVKYYTCADGIVTTKLNQVKRAHALGLLAVQRYFVFDTIAMYNIKKQMSLTSADMVEILPGVIPVVNKYLSSDGKEALIVGGFINTQEDIENAFKSGALSITTSVPGLWYL